jgi:hypothetical protein
VPRSIVIAPTIVSLRLQRFLILSGVATLASACDPNVVIGAKWSVDDGVEWCATSSWLSTPAPFTGDTGNVIPPGSYLITYVSGAQIHDLDIGYEVTDWYYGENGLEAGHHVFGGDSPTTGATSLWLDENGIVASGGSIVEVEDANRGHSWPLEHAGGELSITLYDDDYHDNEGPGARFCIASVVSEAR